MEFSLKPNTVKVWRRYNISDMNSRCWLCVKICNKIKRISIKCSHIWHVDITMCVHWLDTNSMKVWWKCMLPNTNAVLFCDIFFFRQTAVFPTYINLCRKLKIWSFFRPTVSHDYIIYDPFGSTIFLSRCRNISENISVLKSKLKYSIWCNVFNIRCNVYLSIRSLY